MLEQPTAAPHTRAHSSGSTQATVSGEQRQVMCQHPRRVRASPMPPPCPGTPLSTGPLCHGPYLPLPRAQPSSLRAVPTDPLPTFHPPQGDLQSQDGPHQDVGLRQEAAEPPGQVLPVPTHGARRVCAPLRQLPRHGQHPAAPRDAGGSSPAPSTPSYCHVSASAEPFLLLRSSNIEMDGS